MRKADSSTEALICLLAIHIANDLNKLHVHRPGWPRSSKQKATARNLRTVEISLSAKFGVHSNKSVNTF